MDETHKVSIVYYFSNFNILNIIHRRCVIKRFYLHDHLPEVLSTFLLTLQDQALLAKFEDLTKVVQRKSNDKSSLTRNELIRIFYEVWIEDQFLYDVTNYKNKMLSCSSKEFYRSSNDTKFVSAALTKRIEEIKQNIEQRIALAKNGENSEASSANQDLFNSVLQLMFTTLNTLWGDISLSEMIISTVKEKYTDEVTLAETTKRYFSPLLRIRTEESPDVQDSKIEKSVLESKMVNFNQLSKLFDNLDRLISISSSTQQFQFVNKFAVYILELDNKNGIFIEEKYLVKENKENSSIRIIQPVTVLYECKLNSFLLLVLLKKLTVDCFVQSIERLFSHMWSAQLEECSKKTYEIFSKVWQDNLEKKQFSNLYQQSSIFIQQAREELNKTWNKLVVKKIKNLQNNKSCKAAKLDNSSSSTL